MPPYPVYMMLEIEPRAPCMLGKHSTSRAASPAHTCPLDALWLKTICIKKMQRDQLQALVPPLTFWNVCKHSPLLGAESGKEGTRRSSEVLSAILCDPYNVGGL